MDGYPINIVVKLSDVSRTDRGYVTSTGQIQTNGNVGLQTGEVFLFHASEQVSLKPGFSVQSGSLFTASIQNVTNCGFEDGLNSDLWVVPSDFRVASYEETVFPDSNFVYPQPADEFINLRYLEEGLNSIELYTINGQLIKKMQQNAVHSGRTLRISIGDLPSGIYVLSHNFKNYKFKILR